MNNKTYTHLGGTDPERVDTLGMFSAAGTDAVADIIENALDGATVDDLKRMISAAERKFPEIHDTEVRDVMIGTMVAGSLEQHVMCNALGVEFVNDGFGKPNLDAALNTIAAARVERLERV